MNTIEEVEARYRTRLVRAAAALEDLKSQVDRLQRRARQPIAVIGIGCRFPGGADDPDSFWRLLAEGVDAVTEVPVERIDHRDDALEDTVDAARWGAFLSEVDTFDAAFFGISPREATRLDPQHRLILEVAWEALEHAGIVPSRLAGSSTGVFAGLSTNDYLMLNATGEQTRDGYLGTGTTHCFGPGRLSYLLGLRGPSMAVDTACSSSLVAVHLAMQSLRSQESSLALAGGVNLMLNQGVTEMVADLQALSPDGRCRSFDARANGFVRGEGCGFVVLKRLDDAVDDGDRVLAVLRGSAVNQDGHSSGLTAPNPAAQQEMLRQALANAELAPERVGYVETHGTGTALGDPIEVDALVEVLGEPRESGSRCALGAVKTNIGHLEAAAGIAGLIKTILVLRHRSVPANLHFTTLNPRIRLTGTPLTIPAEPLPWTESDGPRVAGISSFGMSGTNAHVIVEEAPSDNGQQPIEATAADQGPAVVPLSARSPEALTELARAYLRRFDRPQDELPRLGELAYTAGTRRGHYEHRLAVVGGSIPELTDSLRAFTAGVSRPGLSHGQVLSGQDPGTVFVFSGQGSQWAGMGRELLDREPVFAEALRECEAHIDEHARFSLIRELAAPAETSRLADTEIAQPALFGVQVALAALLSSWGIVPAALIGHSVGEVAAAHLAGALDLADAARLVVLRGRIMARASGMGSMCSVATDVDRVSAMLAGLPDVEDSVSVAAVNDGASVVLSGGTHELNSVVEHLERQGVHCRDLRVDYAFHSPAMAPLADELAAQLDRLEPRPTSRPLYSTVTGERVIGTELTAGHWARNVGAPVRFADAVGSAAADGHRVFVEVAPHPVLTGNVRQCLDDRGFDGRVVPTLRRDKPGMPRLLGAIGALYTSGVPVDFARLARYPRPLVSLPTYPWQRRSYWLDTRPVEPVLPAIPDTSGAVEPDEPSEPQQPTAGWPGGLAGGSDTAAEVFAAVRADVATVLELASPLEVPVDLPLLEIGMDSLMAVQLRHELAARTGWPLPATLALDHPTVDEISRYLLDLLAEHQTEETTTA